jgi:protein SCO1/2
MNTSSSQHHVAPRSLWLLIPLLVVLLAACSTAPQPKFRLTNITGHMPDLKFQLTDDSGKAVTARDFRGKVTMLYFGYTHCPDVCPTTMAHMHVVMQRMGKLADNIRFLFVSVDPARDTPQVLHQYMNAFDPHDVGLTGTRAQIRALAKRYRVAFDRGKVHKDGSYEVNHSSAIYIFDRKGRVRLLATPLTSNKDLVHDLRLLLSN